MFYDKIQDLDSFTYQSFYMEFYIPTIPYNALQHNTIQCNAKFQLHIRVNKIEFNLERKDETDPTTGTKRGR